MLIIWTILLVGIEEIKMADTNKPNESAEKPVVDEKKVDDASAAKPDAEAKPAADANAKDDAVNKKQAETMSKVIDTSKHFVGVGAGILGKGAKALGGMLSGLSEKILEEQKSDKQDDATDDDAKK